jgi:hypothetical protein
MRLLLIGLACWLLLSLLMIGFLAWIILRRRLPDPEPSRLELLRGLAIDAAKHRAAEGVRESHLSED